MLDIIFSMCEGCKTFIITYNTSAARTIIFVVSLVLFWID